MGKNDLIFIFVIIALSLVTRLYRLDYNNGQTVFDETVYYRNAALSYTRNLDDPNIEHPPFSKELISLSIKLLGDNPWGWRLPSVIFSLLGNVAVYFLIKELLKNRLTAFLTSAFLSLDFMYFIHSRLGVPEIIFVTLSWLSVLFFLKYMRGDSFINRNLLIGTVFFSLALSTKWTALFILIPFTIALITKRNFWKLFLMAVSISLVSPVIYTLTYFPYIHRHALPDYINLQNKIMWYWINFSKKAGNLSPEVYILNHAYTWPLNPAWAYHAVVTTEKTVSLIWAMFNPILWFSSIFVFVKALIRNRVQPLDDGQRFLALLIFSFFVPWLFVTRVEYLYYFLIGLPFLYSFLANTLAKQLKLDPWNFWGYVVTVILVSAYFYPLISGLPVDEKYIRIVPGISPRIEWGNLGSTTPLAN